MDGRARPGRREDSRKIRLSNGTSSRNLDEVASGQGTICFDRRAPREIYIRARANSRRRIFIPIVKLLYAISCASGRGRKKIERRRRDLTIGRNCQQICRESFARFDRRRIKGAHVPRGYILGFWRIVSQRKVRVNFEPIRRGRIGLSEAKLKFNWIFMRVLTMPLVR